MSVLAPVSPFRTSLVQGPHIKLRTYNGETALLALRGMLSKSDFSPLAGWFEMLRANDYVHIVFDVSDADLGHGASEMLRTLSQMGARVVGAESL
jgi:hypothetical protein